MLASAGSVLLAAELALRISGWAPAAHRPPLRLIDEGRHVLLDCYADDPRGYFDVDLTDPQVLARYRAEGVRRLERAAGRAPHCVEVRYNSEGYRGVEVPPRRRGVVRVGVLGDSFSEGQGVELADTWPRRLEALLAEGGGAWEVVSGAHRAADFPELHDMFYRLLLHEPDVVVYAMVPNDAEPSAAFRERHHEVQDWITVQGRATRGRYLDLGPFQSRLAFMARDRLEQMRIGAATLDWYRGLYAAPNQAGWAETQERLRDMDERMRLRGGALLVARWPLLVGFPGAYPLEETHAAVGRFLEAAGIASHDLLPALRDEPADSLIVHRADRHPNERAHALVARSLAPVVRDLAGRRRHPGEEARERD